MRIGLISDTHGLLRPEALTALAGCDHILHAGDVGNIETLDTLRAIAPVTAIRGNIDIHGPTAELPFTETLTLGGKWFHLVHSVHDLDLEPAAAGIDVVLSGHSHQPGSHRHKGVLYINPGSAGPRRFQLPISLATLEMDGDTLTPTIHTLLE
jgi:putative phosphoesterase